ncbi:MAG: hypothetical protein IPP86_17990 [Bacteroidetes bacterium]|nr:hypothetical protein [Bacteroidota bacterium]
MTAQSGERILYEDEYYTMVTEPLAPYLASLKEPIEFRSPSSTFWRGYIGTWKFENKRLFLTDLQAFILDNKEVGIEYLFPGEPVVFANWYTGKLRVPIGDCLYYAHQGFESIFEFDFILKIEKGCLASKRFSHNYRRADRKIKAEAELMERNEKLGYPF